MSKLKDLMIVTDEMVKNVKKTYGKTDEDIKQDLQILYDWWGKQPHLPLVKDDDYLERLLMRNKFRIEQVKKKLDAYFTLKGIYSEFFCSSWDETFKGLQNLRKSSYMFPLKSATKTNERIVYFKIRDSENVDLFDAIGLFRCCILLFEILFKNDYCDTITFFCDLENFKFNYFKKMDPITLYKGMRLVQEGLSCRISGIHYLNAPSFMDMLVKLIKPLLKEGRINVYGSLGELKTAISEELLPKEYGGQAGGLEELQDAWTKEIESHKEFLDERMKYKSDESKRIGKSDYDDMFGTDGTFKKLNLD